MKKLLTLLIVSVTLITSAFSLQLSAGGYGSIGGNVGNTDKRADGVVTGGGLFVNTKFIGGFGLQAEVNFLGNTLTAGDNSLTVSKNSCRVIDVPIMLWYNANLTENLELGGGAGINLGFYSDTNYRNSKNNSTNVGFALGGNLKYKIFGNFGLVLGLHSVFDFLPTTKIEGNNQTTYVFGEGATRKGIFATLGVEVKILQ